MTTTSTFSVSTTDPRLAARIAQVIADFQAEHGDSALSLPEGASAPTEHQDADVDERLVQQIVDALTYQPLHSTQSLALRIWYEAADWVHVGVLQQKLLENGHATNQAHAVLRVRGLLAGFAIRMAQKVEHPAGRTKLAAFVDIDYRNGSVSHRLPEAAREAVRHVLDL